MWQLLIILAIVLLVFGTKRVRNLGGDLGGAIKGFKSAMKDGDDAESGKSDDEPSMADPEPLTAEQAKAEATRTKTGQQSNS